MKKNSIFILGFLLISGTAFCQNGTAANLTSALDQAASQTRTVAGSLVTLLNVIAGLVGLFGIFRVYSKYQNGDQDTNKAIAQFGGAFVFLIAASLATRGFFGI